MVAASMPDSTMPATKGGRSLVDIMIKMLSEELWVSNSVGYKALPIKPIAVAAKSEITHQTVPIILDFLSSDDFSIAMNLNNTWGIPKYPNPQDSVDMIVKNP